MVIDAKELRAALGCFATGVVLVTTSKADGSAVGVTVNSFSSVSIDPPLILFSLARRANVAASFNEASHFAINVLSHEQEAISNMFAKPSTADWTTIDHTSNIDGCAVLREALVHIRCVRHGEFDGGDHVIYVGRVKEFTINKSVHPLLFFAAAMEHFHATCLANCQTHRGR